MASSDSPTPLALGGPELFIGLVAAVGTDHTLLTEILEDVLHSFRYETRVIRLAQLLHAFPRYKKLPAEPADEYIKQHQQAGNEFRRIIKDDAALAVLGTLPIQQARIDRNKDKEKPIPRCAYIIRSLKTPEEVRTLRTIYGEAFFLIGSSAPYQMRRRLLATKIASSRHSFQHDQYLPTAEMLIQHDQEEIGKKHGQNLRNAFHLSDIFVDASDAGRLRESLERGLELIFGNTFHTPTRDEYGIFQATGAAFRSAELGRQVGAAISTESGDIIAVGTNEVPKAGGGLYWAGDDPDHREFRMREDLLHRSFVSTRQSPYRVAASTLAYGSGGHRTPDHKRQNPAAHRKNVLRQRGKRTRLGRRSNVRKPHGRRGSRDGWVSRAVAK
jgi:cytidine deaminase